MISWRNSELCSNKAVSLDSQVDTVIEVTGCKSNVTVSWDKKNEEGEADDPEKRTNTTGQMMDSGTYSYKAQMLLCYIFFSEKKDVLCSEF